MNLNTVFYLIAGILAGVLGGMGMGGGTILIPILTIFLSCSQHLAQAVNLISFIPMAIVALIVHAKNKLIKTKGLLLVIIPATIISLVASLISNELNGDLLKKFFGAFLLVSAVAGFILSRIKKPKNNAKTEERKIKKL